MKAPALQPFGFLESCFEVFFVVAGLHHGRDQLLTRQTTSDHANRVASAINENGLGRYKINELNHLWGFSRAKTKDFNALNHRCWLNRREITMRTHRQLSLIAVLPVVKKLSLSLIAFSLDITSQASHRLKNLKSA